MSVDMRLAARLGALALGRKNARWGVRSGPPAPEDVIDLTSDADEEMVPAAVPQPPPFHVNEQGALVIDDSDDDPADTPPPPNAEPPAAHAASAHGSPDSGARGDALPKRSKTRAPSMFADEEDEPSSPRPAAGGAAAGASMSGDSQSS